MEFEEAEDVNLSSFRRRNKILILISLFLIICLTVIIGTLIIHLVQKNNSEQLYEPLINPAVQAFCIASNDKPSCLSTLNPIISPKSKTEPNQIFTLSLQTASEHLQNAISFLSSSDLISDFDNTTSIITSTNCSVSLRDGLSRLGDALGTMQVNPFVEMQRDEQRVEMTNWIDAAEEDLRSCLDDLDQVGESTAVGAVTEKVLEVKEYVNNSQDFLHEYGRVLQIFWNRIDSAGGDRGLNMEIVFSVCMCGLQLLFMFFMFWSLFRIR